MSRESDGTRSWWDVYLRSHKEVVQLFFRTKILPFKAQGQNVDTKD